MSLENFQSNVLTKLVKLNKDEGNLVNNESNLSLTKDELKAKLENINPTYLEVLQEESRIFVRQGLFEGHLNDTGDTIFDIPDWDKFISAVDAFYVACYAPENEEVEE